MFLVRALPRPIQRCRPGILRRCLIGLESLEGLGGVVCARFSRFRAGARREVQLLREGLEDVVDEGRGICRASWVRYSRVAERTFGGAETCVFSCRPTFLLQEVLCLLLAQLPNGGHISVVLQQREDIIGQDIGVGVGTGAPVSIGLLE